jgi:hypothetical protein
MNSYMSLPVVQKSRGRPGLTKGSRASDDDDDDDDMSLLCSQGPFPASILSQISAVDMAILH